MRHFCMFILLPLFYRSVLVYVHLKHLFSHLYEIIINYRRHCSIPIIYKWKSLIRCWLPVYKCVSYSNELIHSRSLIAYLYEYPNAYRWAELKQKRSSNEQLQLLHWIIIFQFNLMWCRCRTRASKQSFITYGLSLCSWFSVWLCLWALHYTMRDIDYVIRKSFLRGVLLTAFKPQQKFSNK